VFLVGQMPTLWTVIGGVLILSAGLLVVIFGRGEDATSGGLPVGPEPL
jgi:drug/metabolite transporter (DMT)-like permease